MNLESAPPVWYDGTKTSSKRLDAFRIETLPKSGFVSQTTCMRVNEDGTPVPVVTARIYRKGQKWTACIWVSPNRVKAGMGNAYGGAAGRTPAHAMFGAMQAAGYVMNPSNPVWETIESRGSFDQYSTFFKVFCDSLFDGAKFYFDAHC